MLLLDSLLESINIGTSKELPNVLKTRIIHKYEKATRTTIVTERRGRLRKKKNIWKEWLESSQTNHRAPPKSCKNIWLLIMSLLIAPQSSALKVQLTGRWCGKSLSALWRMQRLIWTSQNYFWNNVLWGKTMSYLVTTRSALHGKEEPALYCYIWWRLCGKHRYWKLFRVEGCKHSSQILKNNVQESFKIL